MAKEMKLLQAVIDGNTAAFEQIVKKYQSLVCAITLSGTGRVDISEELAQETFLSAWKNLHQLKELSGFRPWLCAIARNMLHNYYRKKKPVSLESAKLAEITDQTPTPSETLITQEEHTMLEQALKQIPEEYREPLVMYYRQQQSTREVAVGLGLNESTVRTRLQRARQMLREEIAARLERTLEHTAPGKTFTKAVMVAIGGAAIAMSASASAATVNAAGRGASSTIATVMSTVTAKIITAAAVTAVVVGAVFVSKHLSQPEQQPIQPDEIAVVSIEQEPLVTPKSTEATQMEIQEVAANPIEVPKAPKAATPPNADVADIPNMPLNVDVADIPKPEPAPITQTTEVPEISEYVFEPKGVLSGMITDKDSGEPVVGAEIVVYGASVHDGKLVTDVNGFYYLEKIENSKPHMIAIKSKDYIGKPNLDDNYKILIEKDKQKIAHFQLEKACIADLWVEDEQGNPIEGANIKVVDLITNRSTATSRSNTIKPTDKDGYTLIGGSPASKAGYMVIITHKSRTGKLITSPEGHKYHETEPDFAPAHIILKNTDPAIVPTFDVTMKIGKLIKGYIEYSDGVAASDLKIVSEPYWWSNTNLSGQRTEVAPDGSFTLPHITPEKYSISAYYPVNKSLKPIKTIDFVQYDGELHITLSEPSPQSLLTIKGIVKVIKKAPVGNLYIRIYSYNTTTNTYGSGTSIWKYDDNDEAEFEINRLKEGNYRLTFQSEHFKKVVLEDIKPPVDDLYIEMEQVVKPEIVAMVVDKATGKPVTNMRARLIKTASRLGSTYGVSKKWLERSNPQGKAVFTVTPGVYQVQIMADGYGLGVSEGIDTENLKTVTIELTEGGTIKGRVINSAGKPVAGAEILALSYAGGNTVKTRSEFIAKTKSVASDANGNFVLEHLPEGLEAIKADHKDYSPAIISDIAVVDGTVSEEIIVELEEGAIIEGYVFDNNENTIAGARLDYDQSRDRVITRRNTNFVVTDPNGYYRIEGLGEYSYFIARSRGSFTEGVTCRTITPFCGEVTRLDFGGDGYIVTGTVVVDDIPSANIKLALRSNKFSQFLCYTTADADGNFAFTGVIEGEYNITPAYDLHIMFTRVDVVDTDIDLGVIGNNFVDFEAVIESHEDWEDLRQVAIVIPSTYVIGRQLDEIDKQNRLWRFVNIVPGKYDLKIRNDKATSFTVKVDIAKEQSEPLKIKPPKLDAILTGNFYRSISNKPMPRFLLLSNDAKTISAYLFLMKDGVPDANGEFEVKLPTGQYQISYTDGKDSTLLKEFEIISGRHMELEIDLDTTLE